MSYLQGDCLSITFSDNCHIVVFVAKADEYSYYLAFLHYNRAEPPPAEYFEHCSFFVSDLGGEGHSIIAFDVVTINKTALDSAQGVNFAAHLDISGSIGLYGLELMGDVSEITRYFEHHFENPKSQESEKKYLPFKHLVMDLKEVAKHMVPINPFITVKLYREEDQTTYYWQIYGVREPLSLVISQGTIGIAGEYREIKEKPLDNLKEIYTTLIEEKKAEGFREWEELSNMVLQFGTNDSWGNTDDLTFRNDIWDYLDKYLFWTGNGAITGGDIGSGTVNLFFHTISPTSAVSTIVAALAEKGNDRPFIIAIEGEGRLKDGPPFSTRVFYPDNYEGDFNY